MAEPSDLAARHTQRGNVLLAQSDLDGAEDAFNQAIAAAPLANTIRTLVEKIERVVAIRHAARFLSSACRGPARRSSKRSWRRIRRFVPAASSRYWNEASSPCRRFVPGARSANCVRLCKHWAAPTLRRPMRWQTVRSISPTMPFNFRFLPIVHAALPNAKIIHVRRSPLDVAYSCFATYFVDPIPFAHDLDELGRYYRVYGVRTGRRRFRNTSASHARVLPTCVGRRGAGLS